MARREQLNSVAVQDDGAAGLDGRGTGRPNTGSRERVWRGVGERATSATFHIDESPATAIDLQSDTDGARGRLRIRGELTALSVPALREQLEAISLEGPAWLQVDLSLLTLIDSSGVGALVRLFKQLRRRGGDLSVLGLTGQPKLVFQTMGLDRLFC